MGPWKLLTKLRLDSSVVDPSPAKLLSKLGLVSDRRRLV
jgi:hypothetical protein